MREQLKKILKVGQDPREAHIHTFDSIWHLHQDSSFSSEELDVESRSRIIRDVG